MLLHPPPATAGLGLRPHLPRAAASARTASSRRRRPLPVPPPPAAAGQPPASPRPAAGRPPPRLAASSRRWPVSRTAPPGLLPPPRWLLRGGAARGQWQNGLGPRVYGRSRSKPRFRGSTSSVEAVASSRCGSTPRAAAKMSVWEGFTWRLAPDAAPHPRAAAKMSVWEGFPWSRVRSPPKQALYNLGFV